MAGYRFWKRESGQFNFINLLDRTLALIIKIANGFKLVAKKFDANGSGRSGRPAVDDAASLCCFALGIDFHAELISIISKPFGECFWVTGVHW